MLLNADVVMKHSNYTPSPQPFELDLDDLFHPARAFAHPRDVVDDSDLTVNEKRAVLASWASDACAVEAAPALRHAPRSLRASPSSRDRWSSTPRARFLATCTICQRQHPARAGAREEFAPTKAAVTHVRCGGRYRARSRHAVDIAKMSFLCEFFAA